MFFSNERLARRGEAHGANDGELIASFAVVYREFSHAEDTCREGAGGDALQAHRRVEGPAG